MIVRTPNFWDVKEIGSFTGVETFRAVRGHVPHNKAVFGRCISNGWPVFLKVGCPEWGCENVLMEADLLGRSRCANIVELIEYGVHEIDADGDTWQLPYIATEFVENCLVDSLATIPWPATVSVAKGLCAAVSALREAGIVHGDLSPINVLVTETLEAKLCDFGLAVMAGSAPPTERLGPHQPLDEDWGLGADVFGLGALIYSMTGHGDWRRVAYCDAEMVFRNHVPLNARLALTELLTAAASRNWHARERSFDRFKDLLEEVASMSA